MIVFFVEDVSVVVVVTGIVAVDVGEDANVVVVAVVVSIVVFPR